MVSTQHPSEMLVNFDKAYEQLSNSNTPSYALSSNNTTASSELLSGGSNNAGNNGNNHTNSGAFNLMHKHMSGSNSKEGDEEDEVLEGDQAMPPKELSAVSYGDIPSALNNISSPSPSSPTSQGSSLTPTASGSSSSSSLNTFLSAHTGNNSHGDLSRMQAAPFRLQSVSASAPTPVQTVPVSNNNSNNINNNNNIMANHLSNLNLNNSMLAQQPQQQLQLQQQHQQQQQQLSNANTQIILPQHALEGQTHIDITPYLHLPQTDAAKKLGMPTSTLSKRWKEAVVNNRKWPYRAVTKLDKEIMTLLHNIPQGPGAPPLPAEIERTLGLLLKKRQEELKTVIIRI